jgi:hypothetical protein
LFAEGKDGGVSLRLQKGGAIFRAGNADKLLVRKNLFLRDLWGLAPEGCPDLSAGAPGVFFAC